MTLSEKQCAPCRGDVPPLTSEAIGPLARELGGDWAVIESHHLEKRYEFPNFVEALQFVTRIGEVSEEQGHHPELELGWGKVVARIWTHKIDGLTESDFILAAKFDQVR